jgi:hypothetical protein
MIDCFRVLLAPDGTHEADDRTVMEDADHVAPPLHLLVEPLQWVGAPDRAPVLGWEGEGGEHVRCRLIQQCR